ncbi:MAG: hypothetical protein A3K65_05665 [Euryarchaeota archaeon RBG_16_68_12]|nr:MAG: hypothetical protein A3K65_05665 [Euryarchaeota archaeon RBG_16_68_12]
MADVWQSIVDFLSAIASNPAYLLLFIALIILLMVAIVVHHIRKIRNQEPWIHQAWGANWKGRGR